MFTMRLLILIALLTCASAPPLYAMDNELKIDCHMIRNILVGMGVGFVVGIPIDHFSAFADGFAPDRRPGNGVPYTIRLSLVGGSIGFFVSSTCQIRKMREEEKRRELIPDDTLNPSPP
jgi:hypothetical protein